MTKAALIANKNNAQNSTGPTTEDGKAISSMNGLKHGGYTTRFYKIRGGSVGNLKICEDCGDEQIKLCKTPPIEERQCILHNELTLRYTYAHQTGEVKHIEQINMVQLATMDMLFSQKLRYAQMHIGEFEKITNADGVKINVPKIGNDYIYMLLNFMKSLSKTLPDMQLTKQTQEDIDVAWAKLLEADIDPEKATELRNRITNEMTEFRNAYKKSKILEQKDEAIQQFEKNEKMTNEDEDVVFIPDSGDSPFGKVK